MTGDINHFIDNKAFVGSPIERHPVYNPATGSVSGHVALAGETDVKKAIESAQRALPEWSQTPPMQRARVLFRFKALLDSHRDELARLITLEHGKVLSDARGGVLRGTEVVEFACGIPSLLKGEFTENVGRRIDSHSIRQPLGVCAGITPFNFPAMVPMWMAPVAIACGNTFILKPSEKDPSVVIRMAELFAEAGLPPGVLNVVNGGKDAVDVLIEDPRVQALSFVGSTPIARRIYEGGSAHGKRVQALGGAKNHLVVMPDADLGQAVDALMGAAYGSAGERCMAISVAVAVGGVGDALVDQLAERVKALKIGPGIDDDVDMGPLVTSAHRDKVSGYVDVGVSEGASLIVDGRDVSFEGGPDGFFLGGSLFDHVNASMRIYQEEIFGPVLCVVRVADFASALALVNGHEFGNGASIFTRDGDCARAFSSGVEAGMVGVNVPIPVPMAFHSFGGWKNSLFGVQHVHGHDGVRFYTRLKTVTTRWPEGIRAGADFIMPVMN